MYTILVGVVVILVLYLFFKKNNEQKKHEIKVSKLYVHPVKSCKPMEVDEWYIDKTGLLYDRKFMLIYEKTKNHATQREIPKMCLVETIITKEGALTISAPGVDQKLEFLDIKELEESRNRIDVQIWNDVVSAVDCGDEAAKWFQNFLEKKVRLVVTASDHYRPYSKKDVSFKNEGTLFQDGYPFLLTNESSLADLQSRISTRKLDMRIFRPNIVVSGSDAYEEDKWKTFKIGDIKYHNVKPCTRCTLPNVDPDTGDVSKEPRSTLKEYRTVIMKGSEEQLFGVNLLHESEGRIKIGDKIEILSLKDSPKFI
eukprot:gene546-8058_t